MKKFMQTHKVYLTPLSPIHIGCGEDFEPTNYVIDGTTLFYFEPSQLVLNERERTDLLNRVNRNLLAIHQFFYDKKDKIIPISQYVTEISEGFTLEYNQNINNVVQREGNGNEVFNRLQIERTFYLPYQGLPLIPGSSFKGAFITPILSKRHLDNGGKPFIKREKRTSKKDLNSISNKVNQDYLYNINNIKSFDEIKDNFAHNEFRSIKFSDFMPINTIQSKVFYCLNFNRELKDGEKKFNIKIIQRRECIVAGQYRAFSSLLNICEDKINLLPSLKEYLSINHSYYKTIFLEEMNDLVNKGFVPLSYFKNLRDIIDKGGFLIRLGKNGSDSKVLRGKDVAQIEIKPKKHQEVYYQDKATTYWLSSNSKTQTDNLFPFGWALIEIDPKTENESLKSWCEKQPKSNFDRNEILAKREAQKAEKVRLQAEMEAKRLAEQQVEAEKQALLNALSDNQRLVEAKISEWEKMEVKAFNATPNVFAQAKAFLQEVHTLNWSKEDRQYLYDALDPIDKEKIIYKKNTGLDNFNKLSAKSAVEFKKLRNRLVAE